MLEHEYKPLRHAYGFDDVSLVPGDITINPDQVDISFKLGKYTFDIPVLAAAMDAVVDVGFAAKLHSHGGLAVLNLEGVQTRYRNPDEVLQSIAEAPDDKVTALMQQVYNEPIKEELIGKRIQEIKAKGAICAVSITPPSAKRLSPLAAEAGMDILVIQSTVTTARHVSKSYRGLIFSELIQAVRGVPVIVGNCVTYGATLELMESGIDGILVGVGPGAACTSREVLGVGVPQVTSTIDCAAARDNFFKTTGRHVAVITDGGMHTGGDIAKAFASGADAVMLGSIFAQTEEAPGRGYEWGMATPHAALPRGIRIKVGTTAPMSQILFGPTSVTDGTQNLMEALKLSLGVCGASNLQEMHQTQMVIAPSVKTEGKLYQFMQARG